MSTSNVTAQLQFNGIEQTKIAPIVRTDQDKTKHYWIGIDFFDGVKGHSILSANLELSIEAAEKFAEHLDQALTTLKGFRDKEKPK